ncbi:hypothetical protein F5X99DRAFT_406918 [Biscogniauxia marginata]|nr:hypothetical protein F5X99DRAFT_406918 [Biscogniauxia marginata]
MEKAKNILDKLPSFLHFHASFDIQPSDMVKKPLPDFGLFSPVRKSQLNTRVVGGQASSSAETKNTSRNLDQASTTPSTPPQPFVNPGDTYLDSLCEIPLTPRGQSTPNIENLTLSPHSPDKNTTGAKFGSVGYEPIVNAAALLYLDVLTSYHQCILEWPLARPFFNLQTWTKDRKNILQARVNGCLRERDTHKVKSIVEVKPEMRFFGNNLALFGVQETGEMATWISNDQPEAFNGETRDVAYSNV